MKKSVVFKNQTRKVDECFLKKYGRMKSTKKKKYKKGTFDSEFENLFIPGGIVDLLITRLRLKQWLSSFEDNTLFLCKQSVFYRREIKYTHISNVN